MLAMRVVVLGGRFGGLELTSWLSEEFGDRRSYSDRQIRVGLSSASRNSMSCCERTTVSAVKHYYREIVKPGVRLFRRRFVPSTHLTNASSTDDETFDAAFLSWPLALTWIRVQHQDSLRWAMSSTRRRAFATRDVLENFEGGRVLVGVTVYAVQSVRPLRS